MTNEDAVGQGQRTPGRSDDVSTIHQEVQETSPLIELKEKLGLNPDHPVPMNPADLHSVDQLQDELMAAESPEGRPPRRDLRLAEWRWFAVAAAGVLLLGIGWAVMQGVAVGWVVLFGLLLLGLLGIGIAPVLFAGLLRGAEERAARKEAVTVVKRR